MEIRQMSRQHPVAFFRERRVFVVGSQPRFHVADLYFMVECRQRRHEGGGGVPVDQKHVRLFRFHNGIQPPNHVGRDHAQSLVRLHDIQIVFRCQFKERQHLVQHFPVLGRDAEDGIDPVVLLQSPDQGRHFDGFRPGTEHGHHADLPGFLLQGLNRRFGRLGFHGFPGAHPGAGDHVNESPRDQQHDKGRHIIPLSQLDRADSQDAADGIQENDGPLLAHAPRHDAMMEMAFVRFHYGTVISLSPDNGKESIEDWDPQRNEGDQQDDDGGALHGLQGNAGHHEAQELGAGVSHENFRRIEVIGKEAQSAAGYSQHQQGCFRMTGHDRRIGDAKRGDQGDPCRQSVQTVDEVDGVGKAHDPEHCQDAHQHRRQENVAGLVVERNVNESDFRPGGKNNQTGKDLAAQFHLRRHVSQVIVETHQINEGPAENDTHDFHRVGRHDQDGRHRSQVNGQSAKAGNRLAVHPASVLWNVYSADLGRQFNADRSHQPGHHERDAQHHDQTSHISMFPSFKIFSAS